MIQYKLSRISDSAFFALKCFASHLINCEILLKLDNTSTIAYINKTDEVKFPHLKIYHKRLEISMRGKNLWIFTTYIPSKKNSEADLVFKIINVDTEWELNDEVFKIVYKKFRSFSIDFFTSCINKKCNRFCSKFSNPAGTIVDVFTIS